MTFGSQRSVSRDLISVVGKHGLWVIELGYDACNTEEQRASPNSRRRKYLIDPQDVDPVDSSFGSDDFRERFGCALYILA